MKLWQIVAGILIAKGIERIIDGILYRQYERALWRATFKGITRMVKT